eukprot:2350291-Pyramimonas_sp.AAC.1
MGALAGYRRRPPTTATGATALGSAVLQAPGKTTTPGSYSLRTARRRTRMGKFAGSASAVGSSLWRRRASPSPSPTPRSASAR